MEIPMIEITFMIISYVTFVHSKDTWTEKIERHRLKTLKPTKLEAVARMADSQSEQKRFENLLDKFLVERVSGTKGNSDVQQVIRDFMGNLGWKIEEDPFEDNTPFGQKKFVNIIATHNPDSKRKLVLACHFDSKYFEQFKFVGATDSAAPCAMMMHLAYLLNDALNKANQIEPAEVTLQLVFFDGEEAFIRWEDKDSLYGSRHLAEKWSNMASQVGREEEVNMLKTIDVMILLDLIGTQTTKFRNWFPETKKLYEKMSKIEDKLLKASLLDNRSKSSKYFLGELGGGGIQDDHVPFMKLGVRILHLISYPFPAEWHKASDNKEALDMATINNINKILRAFVVEYLHLSV